MSNIKDVYKLECNIFLPSTAELPIPELMSMMQKLLDLYPVNGEGDKQIPYDTSTEYSKKWFNSYNHLLVLIDMKRQEKNTTFPCFFQ